VAAASKLAQISDVVTYEFENVDAKVAEVLEETSFVPQGSQLLRITQNRIIEKTTLQQHGFAVAPFAVIQSQADLAAAEAAVGYPSVLKTALGGYDGKGQVVLREPHQIEKAYQEVAMVGTVAEQPIPCILEKFIAFDREISVLVARNAAGEVQTFPVSENVHMDNILHLSIVPARISNDLRQRAMEMAHLVAEKLQLVGMLAVEMFVGLGSDEILYINELAPRPHNSGHYTQDACVTSQFEQHIRAICNLPLGATDLLTPVVMVNILGEHLQPFLDRIDKLPSSVKVHLYGKQETKVKRKMGHLNVLAPSVEEALGIIRSIGIWERLKYEH
jgi:5-(carboxyamino)imidazole ribonucleotide synthase